MAFEMIFLKLRSWLRDREAIRSLSLKSDMDLEKIGVLRTEIEHAVKHGLASSGA